MMAMKLSVGSVCDRGLSPRRPVNEDRALALPQRGLFVVCDGVGGHSGGEVASQLAVDTIEEAVEQLDGGDPEELLRSALRYANRDIYEMASSRAEFEGMGTTVALLYLDAARDRAIVGHAGDSRVYRFDGRLHRETYDHTDLDDAIRAGRLTPAQAAARGKQNTINRALGIEEEVQAEFKAIPLVEGDAFLLTSDGVTRHLDDEELEELLGQGLEPEALCEEIRSRCYARGAEDNLTAVAVYTAAPAAPEAAPVRRLIDVPATRERSGPRATAGAAGRRSGAGGWLFAILAILVGVLAFFAGRASTTWLASPKPAAPPAAAAKEAFDRGDYAVARAAFSRLSAEEPARADYHYWLGRIGLETGDTREAVSHLEQAARLDATMADAHLYLAAAYERENRPKEAADALRRYGEGEAARETEEAGRARPAAEPPRAAAP